MGVLRLRLHAEIGAAHTADWGKFPELVEAASEEPREQLALSVSAVLEN
jgi:hypothetical protein